jgi:membrane protein
MIADARKKITGFFARRVWEINTRSLGMFKAFLIKTLRLLYVVVEEFMEGNLTLRAMSLVYTTLLSIVPILAISVSVLKGFGVHNQVEPLLLKFLDPLGSKGEEITMNIIGFVENMKVGVLGSLGLGMLIYTVISVIQKIEKSFNYIWRIRKPRSFVRKFSDYISVIIIGPLLIFSAMGITTTVMSSGIVQNILSMEPFGTFFYYFVKISPYVIVSIVFTFLYMFLPNTKVHFQSALFGGVFAGVLWETAGWAFAKFAVSSAKYAAIYSGCAILIMFLIWLYVSWFILLAGAQVSFYHQYPKFLSVKREAFRSSNKLRERVAFLILYYIAYNHYHNIKPWTMEALVDKLNLPFEPIYDVMELLEKNDLIVESNDDPSGYLPARDIETIKLSALASAVRVADDVTLSIEKQVSTVPAVEDILDSMDSAISGSLGEKSLKDVVVSSE